MDLIKVRKRTGRIVPFNKNKIIEAITRAFSSVERDEPARVQKIADSVLTELKKKYDGGVITVEQVQDVVEQVLIKNNLADVAKSYIIYRQKHKELREIKSLMGDVDDDLKLPLNSFKVLKARYLQKDEEGKIVETPRQLFTRVARNIAEQDRRYGSDEDEIKATARKFFKMMTTLEFMPNSPTLFNAGTDKGLSLSACFVLPVGDSMEDIFDAVKYMALVQKSGGGTGFSFSRLRPKGYPVRSTRGVASGPLSFMKVFNVATDVIKQGGKRRGANMGVMRVDHPDIIDFISCKEKDTEMTNFNLSVGMTDEFMSAAEVGGNYPLRDPKTREVVGHLSARKVFSLISTFAWKNGDPGLIFLDEINRKNPTPEVGEIEATNPCGEQPLLPYESCNLGAINLSKMLKETEIGYEMDWKTLRSTVRDAIHFLDNVIDANNYPIPQIEKASRANRKVGLGVMGFADALILLGIPYNSPEAEQFADKVMGFIEDNAREMSIELGRVRGNFPNFKKSIWKDKFPTMRNAACTTVAPTGTTGIIACASSGIEPLFAISYLRKVGNTLGEDLVETNPLFEQVLRKRGIYSEDLMRKVAGRESIQDVQDLPEDIRRVFVSAHDISPEWHLKIQAAVQKHIDSAVSKTINLPNWATIQEIEDIYIRAWKMGCKGITVYRNNSRSEQVLNFYDSSKKPQASNREPQQNPNCNGGEMKPETDDPNKCPNCGSIMVREEGCRNCKGCGYSVCGG
ncbi:MAG: adenosylcobalamin-dependent ribonucleoside-diphosphate reductase [Candidatus Aenigmarchaeota archaeon]|nr:adenosylcobalamin-dependent ribonucleoside-diphosphate reductase [Candidatus Aenigmarchaeota archaeon]